MPKKLPPCSLSEGLARYSDPVLWTELEVLRSRGADTEVFAWVAGVPPTRQDKERDRYQELRTQLHAAFLAKLRGGEVLAAGYDNRHPLRRRTPIPADAWTFLTPNFEHSTAEGVGFSFAGVVVTRVERTIRPVDDDAECGGWLKEQVRLRRGQPIPKKSDLLTLAQHNFGVAERVFERAWKAHAPKRWKKPGRKS